MQFSIQLRDATRQTHCSLKCAIPAERYAPLGSCVRSLEWGLAKGYEFFSFFSPSKSNQLVGSHTSFPPLKNVIKFTHNLFLSHISMQCMQSAILFYQFSVADPGLHGGEDEFPFPSPLLSPPSVLPLMSFPPFLAFPPHSFPFLP